MRRQRQALLFAFVVLLGLPAGCSSYSKVSAQGYQYSKTLYSVCNRQDEPRLTKVAEQIESARAAALLEETEAAWLDAIVATAQAGYWQAATKDARRLMEAQVMKN